jgi:disulfide bond formation protein DsbB
MTDIPAAQAPRSHTPIAFFLAIAMLVVVGSALAFQHIGGYIPCKLCYEQRLPYYFGAPLMLVAFVASLRHRNPLLVRGLLVVGGLLMSYGLYLGVYHSGVEWGWWPGPTDCGMVAAPSSSAGTLLDDINKVVPPSCDKAALRILGLSLAGWNAIASLVLAVIAFRGALKNW